MAHPAAREIMYQKLSGATGLTGLVGGTADPRIFWQQAPNDTDYPLVVFDLASGLIPNITPRDVVNWVYRVSAIGETPASAESVHNQIYAALHEQTLTITGWSNYWLACEGLTTPPVENVDGVQYWRFIGDYRVRASQD